MTHTCATRRLLGGSEPDCRPGVRPYCRSVLDANLNGKNSSPMADELSGREVPFILVTGYGGHKGDPPVPKRVPRVRKTRQL
jgi:hypothetical protein